MIWLFVGGIVALIIFSFFSQKKQLLQTVEDKGGMAKLYAGIVDDLSTRYDVKIAQETEGFLLLEGVYRQTKLFFRLFHTFNNLEAEVIVHYGEADTVKKKWTFSRYSFTADQMAAVLVAFVSSHFGHTVDKTAAPVDCPYFDKLFFSHRQTLIQSGSDKPVQHVHTASLTPSLQHMRYLDTGKSPDAQLIPWQFVGPTEQRKGFVFADAQGNTWTLEDGTFTWHVTKEKFTVKYEVAPPQRRVRTNAEPCSNIGEPPAAACPYFGRKYISRSQLWTDSANKIVLNKNAVVYLTPMVDDLYFQDTTQEPLKRLRLPWTFRTQTDEGYLFAAGRHNRWVLSNDTFTLTSLEHNTQTAYAVAQDISEPKLILPSLGVDGVVLHVTTGAEIVEKYQGEKFSSRKKGDLWGIHYNDIGLEFFSKNGDDLMTICEIIVYKQFKGFADTGLHFDGEVRVDDVMHFYGAGFTLRRSAQHKEAELMYGGISFGVDYDKAMDPSHVMNPEPIHWIRLYSQPPFTLKRDEQGR